MRIRSGSTIDWLALRPGDLLGFSHCSRYGVLINLVTLGVPFYGLSHVSVLAKAPLSRPWPSALSWESTSLCRRPCWMTGLYIDGVQAQRLRARVREYRGHVWHYPLKTPLSRLESVTLTNYCESQLATAYDTVGAMRSRFLGLGWLRRRLCSHEDLTSLFCSEFCAAAYREVGRFETPDASGWHPNGLARALVRRQVCTKPRRLR